MVEGDGGEPLLDEDGLPVIVALSLDEMLGGAVALMEGEGDPLGEAARDGDMEALMLVLGDGSSVVVGVGVPVGGPDGEVDGAASTGTAVSHAAPRQPSSQKQRPLPEVPSSQRPCGPQAQVPVQDAPNRPRSHCVQL